MKSSGLIILSVPMGKECCHGVNETSLLKSCTSQNIIKQQLLLYFHSGCQNRGMRNIALFFCDVTIKWFVPTHSKTLHATPAGRRFKKVGFTFIDESWVIRARWREIRRFVLEFKASYFFLNSYIWRFLFAKSYLRVQRNNTLNLECKEVRDQFLENLDFPIHFL